MAKETRERIMQSMRHEARPWHSALYVPQTPLCLDTAYVDEELNVQFNKCYVRLWDDGTVEWIEQKGGRTTITHGSFAHPHMWRLPEGFSGDAPRTIERTDFEGPVDPKHIIRHLYHRSNANTVLETVGNHHPVNIDFTISQLLKDVDTGSTYRFFLTLGRFCLQFNTELRGFCVCFAPLVFFGGAT